MFLVSIVKLIGAVSAGLEYLILMLLGGRSIFPSDDKLAQDREAWKLVHAKFTISMLWIMIFTVTLMVLAIIAIPPDWMVK